MGIEHIENIDKKTVKRKPRGRKIRPRESQKNKDIIPTRPGRKIGYMRVSTEKQDMALQFEAMTDAGIAYDDIFADTISGSKVSRKWRDACLKFLVPGDTLYVWKLDRFSRSLMDLLNQLAALDERGVNFVSLTQHLDTATPMGRMTVQIIGAFAEFEREMIRERVTAGIRAKTESTSVRWGRQPAVEYDEEEIKRLLREKVPHRQIVKMTGASKGTVGNISKTMKEKKHGTEKTT